MNRPFSAFGILLTLLVLATLGVSSSRRSTEVRALPRAAESFTRRCGGGTVVIILPLAKPALGDPQIVPARVALASEVPEVQATEPVDCRSYGDAEYDLVVYGSQPPLAEAADRQGSALQAASLQADELLDLFQSLTAADRKNRSKMPGGFLRRFGQPRTLVLGLGNWVLQQLEQMPLAWLAIRLADRDHQPPITWSDYVKFTDTVVTHAALPRPAKVELVAIRHVQSGHWLLRSAASSLNHLALWLEAAADELQEPKGQIAAH